jgi:hypothetical protein
MRTFLFAFAPYLDAAWTIQIQPTVQGFDAASSQLTLETNMTTTPPVITGTAPSAPYAGGSGLAIAWKTSSIFNGRRVQGRTFLVPALGAFQNDGTLTTAVITALQSAGNALIAAASPSFSIWAKTYNTAVNPPVQTGGDRFDVTSCSVKDMAAQLRSRRL